MVQLRHLLESMRGELAETNMAKKRDEEAAKAHLSERALLIDECQSRLRDATSTQWPGMWSPLHRYVRVEQRRANAGDHTSLLPPIHHC